MGAFLALLAISGEFTNIRDYAYNMFSEKTENRKNYVENMLSDKISPVYDTAIDIIAMTEDYLDKTGYSSADISTNKQINKDIIRLSSNKLVELLRKSYVNDAFIILESGELYNKDDIIKKSGLYLRDLDISSYDRTNNSDLLIEMGSSDIAKDMGISLDSEWSAHLDVSRLDQKASAFFFDTIKNAKDNPEIPIISLGHWTSFSAIAPKWPPSMKYTIPLITSDGTVYGVLGVGILEKTFLGAIPSYDFFDDCACYILGMDEKGNDEYTPIIHSGAIFNRLVTEDTIISDKVKLSSKIYDFNEDSDINSIGCIIPMKLYNAGSPYINEKWALISVGDKEKILKIYNTILRTLFISTALSIIFSLICAVVISNRFTAPVAKISALLNTKKKESGIISFDSSGITEIDQLSSSITELQIAVREQASKVSKIISMSGMGIGVFMYDLREKNVFVGESFIELLNIDSLPAEDTLLDTKDFLKLINEIDDKGVLSSSGFLSYLHAAGIKDETNVNNEADANNETGINNEADTKAETIELYSDSQKRWFRFKVMSVQDNVIGIVTDVTSTIIEKRKIEYERDYDVTTGLLNRRAYLNLISRLFSTPEKLKTAAFIMWDLDNLKYVNDTYGHDFGDDYIKSAANIFKRFRDYGGIVSRLSGDEFNTFLYGFDTKDEIRSIVSDIQMKMNDGYCVLPDGTHFKIRLSGGLAWYPDDSVSHETLIKYADFAMYTIKHSTKGNLAEFDIKTYNKNSILITGVEEMNKIIDEERIKYAFQSIVSAKTGEIYGYEALMRPQSEILKSPLDLIRIAKAGAKLYEIERITWLIALRSFRNLRETGIIKKNARIFINSISDCKMKVDDVLRIEEENSDILDKIVLELLEGEQTNEEFMRKKQKRADKWNAMIALDDFGSGYNSEYALITLNPDLIKIDRSIISGCDNDISRQSIIMSLVSHAKLRNILVLAEGVETSDELRTVIECGVDLIQGYYVSRPLFEPEPVPEKIKEEIKSYQ